MRDKPKIVLLIVNVALYKGNHRNNSNIPSIQYKRQE
jgi:hypothetical protein